MVALGRRNTGSLQRILRHTYDRGHEPVSCHLPLCVKSLRHQGTTRVSLERIEITPFAVIAGDILQNRRTGQLTILRNQVRKVLHWSQGELVLITSTNPDDSLAAYLAQRGALPVDKAMQIGATQPT